MVDIGQVVYACIVCTECAAECAAVYVSYYD